jgi:putative tryptophan/tyrosine transport system substrate-binding protein
MNQRRLLVLALGATFSGQAALLQAQALGGGRRRIGVLAPSTQAKKEITLKPFFDQMRQLGWVEGQNIAYDRAYADDQQQTLPALAAELVARKPDLIFAPPTPSALAAKLATATIPIVFAAVWDPISTGLVASLARPGGNVTGICVFAESLAPKRFQPMREILPGVKRIGWLGDSTDPATRIEQQALRPLAASMGLTMIYAEGDNPAAIYTGTSPLVYNLRARLMELANGKRVPVISYRAQFADAGALFAYGSSLADQLRRSAFLVDKVLKGAKPADLPVEQASLFELIVNLKAAKALGITVPQSFLLRAERVIE